MARAIRAWGSRKPNATRVSSRILVLVDSIRAVGQPVVEAVVDGLEVFDDLAL